ncbi:hypothetical protein N7528_008537 [Penicillium herquei]|nr:hypothetical protein N7528_008537 [Penicillium herquei]
MPPLRSGRASKACDLCRRNKTRCYAGTGPGNTCLRCHTLSLSCSLERFHRNGLSESLSVTTHENDTINENSPPSPDRKSSTDARLERLEKTVGLLVDRLDAQFKDQGESTHSTLRRPAEPIPSELNPAPIILIRGAADDAGVSSQEQADYQFHCSSDVISAGLVTTPTAHSLLKLFQVHYGRWVRFPDDVSTETLLSRVRNSPLLLCSVLLIAVRHNKQALEDELAPRLFHKAKKLLQEAMLKVPQSIEYFQATLILSLWSTTIGQLPLSVDSWLVTGYALQQGLASPCFSESSKRSRDWQLEKSHSDALCLWNHLCVAHLQYCVGTRRQAMLNQKHIDACQEVFEHITLTNFEARMVAEVKLYWVIYEKCCPQSEQVDLSKAKSALKAWRTEWASLFNEPRSQFLQMGFHFAHLLAYYESAKYPQSIMDASAILEMIDLASAIINVAISTTDDRTRHLTDHIYHVVTFSALTLCRLVHEYYAQLAAAHIHIQSLDRLVLKLINWLRSIGLPCHAAHLLGDIISSQFRKLRSEAGSGCHDTLYETEQDRGALSDLVALSLISNPDMVFPDLIGSELFDMEDGSSWPEWNQI